MILIYMGVMSIATFVLFGIDKKKAIAHQWRIKEATLILMSFLGGALGGIIGMSLFRHKTRKPKFFIGVPLALICNIATVVLIYYFFGKM